MNNLLPFQALAVKTALAKKKMLINLPAGSGKTLIALEVAVQSKCKRVLVVCPAFLRLNWEFELEKWLPGAWITYVLTSEEGVQTVAFEKQVFAIVGYSYFQKKGNVTALQKQHWDLVICDESHHLRKWESRRCKDVILKIARLRERLLFLTATPLVTSAADLHPTFAVMQPGKWGKFSDFCDQYCNKVPDVFNPKGFCYEGIRNADELKERSKEFIVTAKKSVILAELPEKRVIDLPIAIGKCKEIEGISEMLERIIDGESDEEIKTERERIGKAKIASVLELLETFPADEPVVIFAWHRSVATKLQESIPDSDLIIGGINEKQRMEIIKRFSDGEINKLVVSIAAGGLGLNLQRAGIAIFGELPYSYAEFEQCSDRVHRIGSQRKVRIYKLVAVDSIDEDINKIIEKKRLAAHKAGVQT